MVDGLAGSVWPMQDETGWEGNVAGLAAAAVGGRDEVVLVRPDGTVRGVASKLAAHEPPGELHLAFSVLLFTREGNLLMQRRAAAKYHFPGMWANACCSHPRPGEHVGDAAARRLLEELGISCPLTEVGSFLYRAHCAASGLVEHELDHVLVGTVDKGVVEGLTPDPAEVDGIELVDPASLLDPGAERAGVDHCPSPIESTRPLAPWLAPALLLARRHRPLADLT